MPQLLPYHWFSQLSFTLAVLLLLTHIIGVYVMPNHLQLNVVRLYLSKL